MSVSVQIHAVGQRTLRVLPTELRHEVEEFLFDRRARNLSPRTIDFYQEKLDLFAAHCEAQGVERVEDLTADLLRRWLLEEGKHRTPGGVHVLYRSARVFVRWWEDEFEPEGWRNPFAKLRAPRVPLKILDPVPNEDLKAMLATCRGRKFLPARDKAILIGLLDTGCRAAEFCAIDLGDINGKTGAIRIREAKGGDERTVYLSDPGWAALVRYFHFRRDKQDADPVWVGRDRKTRLKYAGLRSIVRSRAYKAGVPVPSLHSFRRGCALSMWRSGADLLGISRYLGHKQMETTRRYLALSEDDLAEMHRRHAPGDKLFA
jgi:site-specific recombinase XerD